MKKSILISAVILGAALTPAMALEVSKSADITAPPEKVWKTIGGFCGIGDWHPAVEKCELSKKGDKTLRTLSLKGGGTILEEQVSRDDKTMEYTYIILESPLPVDAYKSTISVEKAGNGSKVNWKGTFKAKGADDTKAQEVIDGIYEAGFKGISDKAK